MDNRNLGDQDLRNRHGIVEKDLGHYPECPDGLAHRLVIRLKDIDFIDPLRSDNSVTGCDCLFHDLSIQFLALSGGQFFGIVQAKDHAVIRKDHRPSHNRSGERSPARLVNSADQSIAVLLTLPFKAPHFLKALLFCLQLSQRSFRTLHQFPDSRPVVTAKLFCEMNQSRLVRPGYFLPSFRYCRCRLCHPLLPAFPEVYSSSPNRQSGAYRSQSLPLMSDL